MTHIATPSGLTLNSGSANVPITAKGAGFLTDGYVLTYDDSRCEIALKLSAGSGGTQIYNGLSPTTCTVGGLSAGSSISGCTLSQIIQKIVVPACLPTVTAPSRTFSLSCSPSAATSGFYEIGTYICTIGSQTYNQGCIAPVYLPNTCDKRTGPPNTYVYTGLFGTISSGSTYLSNSVPFTPHYITGVTETYTGKVCYDAGPTIYDSCANVYCTACPASATVVLSEAISAIYPYFWGVSGSTLTAGQTLLNSGTKVINTSTSSITIDFNVSTPSKYLWFAIPTTSGIKIKWFGSNAPTTNTEPIPGGLFNGANPQLVCSPSGLWGIPTCISYDFYISKYATNTCSGTQYTITFTT
jgi:hypothetical protein